MVDISPYKQNATLTARPPMVEVTVIATALALALAGFGAAVLPSPGWAVVVFGPCVALVALGVWRSYPHAEFGLCNTVTLGRAALLSLLVGALFDAGAVSPWLVFWVGLTILSLDGVDGWLARRSQLKSEFGARFDMEVDAALGAVLAMWLLLSGKTGAEILVLGFMRYAFVLAGLVWPALRRELPDSMRRKTICVVQIGTLIALACPLFPTVLVPWVAGLASALLVLSFGIDTAWLARHVR
ncbi:CDP-alcohol phosphatidyltransferase [Roseovarius sp. THAF9]|uniref:CDP-alcohol phosphatidyltransferase family protein n=1 Tax=Roseovarius sp. THAF9 TaxID=2587847 RepID=UPI0012A91898|nr:CDP-alcohol phosphatidyltransferase family protein [Roseovarius sp. THAF9]QFT93646.1 CDP-alcohol phosphatidyltransferase [Roseovarius sp. THAF9]